MKSLIVLLFFFIPLMSCHAKLQDATSMESSVLSVKDSLPDLRRDTLKKEILHFHLPYQLDNPVQRFALPEQLKEISGLSMSTSNKEVLMATQDEDGIIFQINKNTGEVEQEYPYYKEGDYEAIEVVRDTLYVVKSNGTIYEVYDLEKSPPFVQKHKSFLTKANDVEGLCYDAKENRLLIACKGIPMTEESEEDNKFQKVIYSFYLDDNRMELEPTFVFNLSDLQHYLEGREAMAQYDQLYGYFNPSVESLIFSPSAIAIHPITGNIYMTSSQKKMLMVFDREGNILHLEKMDKAIHPQPEGLAFDEDGTLYMANEGKESGAGTILKFAYHPEITTH